MAPRLTMAPLSTVSICSKAPVTAMNRGADAAAHCQGILHILLEKTPKQRPSRASGNDRCRIDNGSHTVHMLSFALSDYRKSYLEPCFLSIEKREGRYPPHISFRLSNSQPDTQSSFPGAECRIFFIQPAADGVQILLDLIVIIAGQIISRCGIAASPLLCFLQKGLLTKRRDSHGLWIFQM